ncbi:hypothetical protein, partial [Leclercia adecarboxylata]|uniref:hypothetical protein n=1 Tax=Leclercia adecarboxylata TaxID=83655 RepID=UPI00234D5B42
TQTFVITEPQPLVTTITSTAQANCGVSNGSATYTATGGTTAYTYSWVTSNPSISYTTTSTTTSSLSAGFNQLTVIDAHGCTTNTSVNITNPNSPVVTTTVINVNCFGQATGTVNTTVTQGTPTYSYTWSNTA